MVETGTEVNGEWLLLDPAGAVYWPAEMTLVVADLHLEKGSAFAARGQFLPPYDTRTTLSRLGALLDRYAPRRVISLGDSFHDGAAADRLDAFERALIAQYGRRADWIWIAGNHDADPPAWLGGTIASEIAIGGLVFRHQPGLVPQAGEMAGHLHPCATVTRRGRSLRRRCFVSDGNRMVLPAFGAYAGGLDLWEDAIAALFADAFAAFVLGARRVYAVAGRGAPHAIWRKSSDEDQPRKAATSTVSTP